MGACEALARPRQSVLVKPTIPPPPPVASTELEAGVKGAHSLSACGIDTPSSLPHALHRMHDALLHRCACRMRE